MNISNLGYNFFDLNDPFYNDICSTFSYDGQDMSLSERKNLKNSLNASLLYSCINNCFFSDIDPKTLRTICLCKSNYYIINSIYSNNKEINSDKNNLNDTSIMDEFSKSANIKIVKCFRKIFSSEGFIKNYGFYLMSSLLFVEIIISIFFPLSKVDKQLNKFCEKVLKQIKERILL